MRSLLSAGVALLALTQAAWSQQAASQPNVQPAGDIVLDEILVTAGRTPVEAEKSGRAYTVISGEQLERNQIRYVADALRLVPGFAVSQTGAAGGFTQVRVRGAEANHLLVLIDGVEASETASGEFDFGSLIVDEIDRIEVLRGPQSAFWGSNASAGVVNIITRRGERDGSVRVRGRTEAGSDGSWLGGASVSGGGPTYDLAFSGVHRHTGGFNISDFGSEDDGARNTTLNGKFNADLSPVLRLDGTLRFVDRKSDTDAQDFNFGSPTYGQVLDTDDNLATREFVGSLGATHTALDGALVQRARFTGSDTHRENFSGGGLSSENEGDRLNGLYQATYGFDTSGGLLASHFITGGYEWERETFLPDHLTDRLDRSTNSFVGEYRGEFAEQVFLNAAVRHDLNDAFADATTYSLSGAWALPSSGTRFHASVGTGVTNPTFFEQFGFVPTQFVGNPGLTPEESFGWDIGVEQAFFSNQLIVDLTYFNQNLTDEIATDFSGVLPTPFNRSGESERQGVELSATLDFLNGFTTTATYTYTDATEQSAAGGARLTEIRRPRHSGSVTAAYTFLEDHARLFGEVVFNADQFDTDFATFTPVKLDDYAVVNIGGSYRFNEHIEGLARVENLFDEDYEEVFGFNTQGITAFVGVRGQF